MSHDYPAVGAPPSKSLQALFDEYSRLAELYGWGGNVYLLAVKLRGLLELLARLPVDPAYCEERVRDLMRRGAGERELIGFIDSLRGRIERFLETPELEELLAAVRGRYFRSFRLESENARIQSLLAPRDNPNPLAQILNALLKRGEATLQRTEPPR